MKKFNCSYKYPESNGVVKQPIYKANKGYKLLSTYVLLYKNETANFPYPKTIPTRKYFFLPTANAIFVSPYTRAFPLSLPFANVFAANEASDKVAAL